MARDSAIYIVDVYVPNEGEPESALEITILRIKALDSRPKVVVHSYIMPSAYHLARIRWNDAHSHGINKEIFRSGAYPTLVDIYSRDFLKDKQVVCFCSNLDPVQTLVKNASSCFSILNTWQEVFAGNELVSSFTSCRAMLDYMGLEVQDRSNTGYTPSMKRSHAYLAIWLYLSNCSQYQIQPNYGDSTLAKNNFWPLSSVVEPWYQGNPKDFDEIPSEALCDYFSERLPDYLNWENLCIYQNDWIFGRNRNYNVQLTKQDAMLDFIFYRLFNFKKRLLVLSFYSLYHNRTEYARLIALHQGQFSALKNYVKEDFAAFLISHLDDFLSGTQKRIIIDALVDQALQSKFEKPVEQFNFKDMLKHQDEGSLNFVQQHLESNHNIVWYQEISTKEDLLYRCFVIKGSIVERNECIDHINTKISELLQEARNPFAPCWLSLELKEWIQAITGFTWMELSGPVRASDSESLQNTRFSIQEIIAKRSKGFLRSYLNNFKTIINDINNLPEGQHNTFCFSFMAITHDVIVDKTDAGKGLFARLKNLF